MKTIFYKICEQENANYWFEDTPCKEWFTLENTLYEPNGNIHKRTIVSEGDRNFIRTIVPFVTQDSFSDEGIVRRIGLNII